MPLNADELGKKGEARFAEICSDTKLVRNPSIDHDRTGWDYIVEFEQQAPIGRETLDTRRAPLSAHVQVKTMWASNDRFRMRLSAAERLAKEPKPAFVYVFKVNEKLEFVSAHLVHVLDANLAAILKRLRKEQAEGTKSHQINKKYISFKASTSGRKIKPTGAALRQAIFDFCGSDLDAYIDRKRKQTQELGFEPGRFQATTTFKVESMDGLIDGLLGLRELEVTAGQAFETRFGIKLSLNEPNFAKSVMRVQPATADTCIVTVKETPLSPPATFLADILFPPLASLPKEHLKMLVQNPLFRLLIAGNRIQFTTDEQAISAARLKIDDWRNFFRMLIALCRGAEMTLKPERLHEVTFPMRLPDAARQLEYESMQEALEATQRLLKLAGAPEPAVGIDGFGSLARDLVKLDKIFSSPANADPIGFVVDWPLERAVPDKMDFLCVNFVRMENLTLAHSSMAEMLPQSSEGRTIWKSKTVTPCEITFVRDFPVDYERFVERAKQKTKLTNSIIAEALTDHKSTEADEKDA
ncbi:hypothetical protein AAFG13_35830 [Bradyrhizobium sp. B124]|uniref:hypothetical protein n=1 Tax=Bradyrhizobium sp. B124 TaxID=3140245 RepID=UPI003182CFF3